MRISNYSGIQAARKQPGAARKGDAAGFSLRMNAGSATQNGAAIDGAVNLTPLGSLLAVQDDGHDHGKPRSEYHRGMLTLDLLDELRLELLEGRPNRALLQEIEEMAQYRSETEVDAGIRDVMDEIELRAAVEIAKLEQESHSQHTQY